MQLNLQFRAGQESTGGRPCLLLTLGHPAEHHVPGAQARMTRRQAEQSAAGRDFQVVGVRSEGKDGQWPSRRLGRLDPQRNHTVTAPVAAIGAFAGAASTFAAPDRSGSHTIQGQVPRWYISSS